MKNFKLTLIMLLGIMGFVKTSIAQIQPNGLYLSFNDYRQHKLSYANNGKGNKIVIHDFLQQKNITVTTDGTKQVFAKNSIYGYRNNSHDYRLLGNKGYQIIDTVGFYIYSSDVLSQEGKGLKPVKTDFFSTKGDGEIMPLTQDNIAKAFVKNHKFRYLVQAEFKSDRDMDEYDNGVKEYKIKELYIDSNK
ncbi:hypothetical protein SAMN05421821_116135 [Mucilaginibacter lappiensis]|uniref:Transglutaminase-like putative cysteine protease n=1 Tax=Mucilaginibacter lappiensis TaxID=354630 RepID=A0ABR6PQI7_9SPHI|nr:hypothetical protein [Mucilaginibacter lappiensis]MBB6112046.1 transglutaminase-like putative cysteine protease [Mucilaginibacter lappiensis]SIR95519.1 hypothetical protein SAMN05421821_116135 [Mucilaginibacter lappiensis]